MGTNLSEGYNVPEHTVTTFVNSCGVSIPHPVSGVTVDWGVLTASGYIHESLKIWI